MSDDHDAFELSRRLHAPIAPAPIVTLPTWPVTVCTVSLRNGGVIITRRNVDEYYPRDWT